MFAVAFEVDADRMAAIIGAIDTHALRQVTWATLGAFDLSQAYVPVQTGRLMASGETQVDPGSLTGILGYTAPYAATVEYGGDGRPGRFYVSQAVSETTTAFFARCAKIEDLA